MEAKQKSTPAFIVIFAGILTSCAYAVPDLDERFLDIYKDGKWLIEFYAPWCGHCKKLEPIYQKVFNQLKHSDVKVAKIDATRFSTVSSQFDVRGFPTIKFFNGDNVHNFRGERTADDILEFVKKAKGPSVRRIASIGKFNEVKSEHSDGVFYMYVGDDDPNNELFTKYSSIASEQISLAYFYSGTKNILPEKIASNIAVLPTILVFKDGTVYEYEAPKSVATMSSLRQWLNGERYPAFPLISGGNINEMADTGKFLVIFVISKDPDRKMLNQRISDVGRYLAKSERGKFHSNFQFLWMNDPDTVNNIMMTFITQPYILVLDPTVHLYYIMSTPIEDSDATTIGNFLTAVKDGKVQAYGGTGFLQRLKRLFFDILVTVIEVWQSSRWLFLIMFGIPTGVISIVCYSLCCMDTVDDEIHSDEEDSEDEDYRQYLKEQQEQKQLFEKEREDTPASGHEKAE